MDKYWELVIYYNHGVIIRARGINQKGEEYLFVSLVQRVENSKEDKLKWNYARHAYDKIPQSFPPRSTKSWKYWINRMPPSSLELLKIEAYKFYPISKEAFEKDFE